MKTKKKDHIVVFFAAFLEKLCVTQLKILFYFFFVLVNFALLSRTKHIFSPTCFVCETP